MQAVILHCEKNSRFHFGETTEIRSNTLTDTSVYIHSDLLFSAFISQLSVIEPSKVEVFVEYFTKQQIGISSAFHCLEHTSSKQKIFFLPKPVSLNLFHQEGLDHKKLKKIQFLSWKVWQEQLLPNEWFDANKCRIIDGRFVVHQSEINNADELIDLSVFKKEDSLKVRKHTQEVEGNLYSQTDLFLLGNDYFSVHWYFLCQTNLPSEDEDLFWKVWESLIKTGIGGERSTGAGQMESLTKYKDLPELFLQKGSQEVALSLIFPKEEEKASLHLYQTKLRGGMFLAENYRLKVVQAVLEGAIHQGLQGQIVHLHHQASDGIRLRNGLAFSIALPPKYSV
jgi:CRISPR-associated protein Csm4